MPSNKFNKLTKLYNEAQGDFLWAGESKRYLQSLLIQFLIVEEACKILALRAIKKKIRRSDLVSKKEEKYTFNEAVNDLRLLNAVTELEFKMLNDYKLGRNKYIHKIVEKDFRKLNRGIRSFYHQGGQIVSRILFKKLEK